LERHAVGNDSVVMEVLLT